VIYEKPVNRQDAFRMLSELRGNTIQVISAVSIFYRTTSGMRERCFEDITEMHMHEYDDEMINAYLDTDGGVGFSGSLAYQGAAFLMVKGISGCFYNLIGFPAPRFYQEFTKISHQIV
jgi:septum formation protein